MASDDIPQLDGENEDSTEESLQLDENNSDVDDMGDPFSEDEADNPFSDGEQ